MVLFQTKQKSTTRCSWWTLLYQKKQGTECFLKISTAISSLPASIQSCRCDVSFKQEFIW